MNKIIEEQLRKVTEADLSNFDKTSNTYHIPKKTRIKVDLEKCYLIHLLPRAFNNEIVAVN